MPFFMVDDQFHSHLKTQRLIDKGQTGVAAVGLWALVGSQVQSQLADGTVEPSAWRLVGDRRMFNRLAKLLVEVGLWEQRADDEEGFQYHDWHDIGYQKGAKVKLNRARRKETKDPAIINAVIARDGDQCRYCGRKVKPSDRHSDAGRTYDHVIPGLAGGVENLVTACRGCNRKKAQRTPEQAKMTLLLPQFGPDSVAELQQDCNTTAESGRVNNRESAGEPQGGGNSQTRARPEPDQSLGLPLRARYGQGNRQGRGEGSPGGAPPGDAAEPARVGPAGRPPPTGSPPGHTGSPWHNWHGPPPDVDQPTCPDHGLDMPCRKCTSAHFDEPAQRTEVVPS